MTAVERWTKWLAGLSVEYGTFAGRDFPTTRHQFRRLEEILGSLRNRKLPTGNGVFPAAISGLTEDEQAAIADELLPVFRGAREVAVAALCAFGEEGEIVAGLRDPAVSAPTAEEEATWNQLVAASAQVLSALRAAVVRPDAAANVRHHAARGSALVSSLGLYVNDGQTLRSFEVPPLPASYWEAPRGAWPRLALSSVCGGIELRTAEPDDGPPSAAQDDDHFLFHAKAPDGDELFDHCMCALAEAAGLWSPDDEDDDDDDDGAVPIVIDGEVFLGWLLARRARVMDLRSFVVILDDERVVWIRTEQDANERTVHREPPCVLAPSLLDYLRAVRDLCEAPSLA